MKFRAVFASLVVASTVAAGCSKAPNEVVESAVDKPATEPEIDADPLALLPSGPVAMGVLNAKALFSSEFGPDLVSLAEAVLPLPAEAGFDARRDLQTVYLATYSMQGLDVVGVVSANLDPEAIEQSVSAQKPTPLGPPLSRSQYAGRTVYGLNDMGFVVLTRRTALAGNTTALRRALDRIEEGRVKRDLPQWLESLVATPNAPIVVALDLVGNPIPDAVRHQMPFVEGAETVRVLANFEPPGLNLAGSVTHATEAEAQAGSQQLLARVGELEVAARFLALIGIQNPLVKFEAEPKGKDVRFVAGLSGPVLKDILTRARQWLPMPTRNSPPTPSEAAAASGQKPVLGASQ